MYIGIDWEDSLETFKAYEVLAPSNPDDYYDVPDKTEQVWVLVLTSIRKGPVYSHTPRKFFQVIDIADYRYRLRSWIPAILKVSYPKPYHKDDFDDTVTISGVEIPVFHLNHTFESLDIIPLPISLSVTKQDRDKFHQQPRICSDVMRQYDSDILDKFKAYLLEDPRFEKSDSDLVYKPSKENRVFQLDCTNNAYSVRVGGTYYEMPLGTFNSMKCTLDQYLMKIYE